MARKVTMGADWNAMRSEMFGGSPFQLWSRFSCEIADDLIVSPLLFGTLRERDGRDEVYTLLPERLIVMHARGAEHVAMLLDEVAPLLERFPFPFVFDADKRRLYPAFNRDRELSIDELFPILHAIARVYEPNDALVDALVERQRKAFGDLATLEDATTHLAHGRVQQRMADAARRVEASPIRLWEAMLWRGENYRWELIAGEVPLVGDLFSPLAANRTLVQCVKDAEHAFSARARESNGWIVCGPMRMQQRGSRVEIRYRLSPSDRRVAFQPRTRLAGDDAVPSMFAALLAGGGSGKSEMIHGYTDSVIEFADPAGAARELAEQIRRCTGAEVIESPPDDDGPADWPEEPSSSWYVRWWKRWVYVLMPTHRDDALPFDAQAGFHLSDGFMLSSRMRTRGP